MSDTPQQSNLVPRETMPQSISVVIPCFNEQEVIAQTHQRLKAVLEAVAISSEVIYVDDGSADRTWPMLEEIQRNDAGVKILQLSRNFGHQVALTAGLDQSRGEVVLVMDADLQDPPELLPEMLAYWLQGYDVVYGKRLEREGETRAKRLTSYFFYRLLSKLSSVEIPLDTGDFRLISRRTLDALSELRENQRYLRGMISWVGFPQKALEYDRPARAAGETKYPPRKLLMLALDGLTSFSPAPLRAVSYLGFALSIFAFLYIVLVIGLKIAGINFRGYTSIMGTILLLGGVQLIVLGVIGEYIGRIFQQTKNRPLYFLSSMRGEPLAGQSSAPGNNQPIQFETRQANRK